MKALNQFEQGSLAWLQARSGLATASEFGKLVTPLWKIRVGETPLTYVALKAAEKWTGGVFDDVGAWAMEQGQILEEEAIPWAEIMWDMNIERVGLIVSDCGRYGCSPDGVMGEEGVEIKCLQPTNHVKAILSGQVPEDYRAQIQGGMFITGFKTWRFVAYSRRFPKLVLTVERDDEAQKAIAEALALFSNRLDAALAKIKALNGGPPPRQSAPPPPPPAFEHDLNDVPS